LLIPLMYLMVVSEAINPKIIRIKLIAKTTFVGADNFIMKPSLNFFLCKLHIININNYLLNFA